MVIKMSMMIKYLKIIVCIGVLLFISSVGRSEGIDTKLRTGIKVESDLAKRLEGILEFQYRLSHNFAQFDRILVEPSLQYKPWKHIRFGVGYRFIVKDDPKHQREFGHRVNLSARYKGTLAKRYSVAVKSGLQYGYWQLNNSFLGNKNKLINRNSLEVEHQLFGFPLSPFVGGEIFSHLNYDKGAVFSQYRLALGTHYNMTKKIRLSMSYMYENELVKPDLDSQILTIVFKYSL
ncbi:DUF2490 domain-containing protein [Puteibacter caeruleilacunae]|nr:DUF2490 domain-containing protein [Puteibacter caeruleilacunae]